MIGMYSGDIASEPHIARGDDANDVTNLTQICVQKNGGGTGDTLPTGIAGKVKSQSLLLNTIRYLPINAYIQPYLGIGAGYKRTDLRIKRGNLVTNNPEIAALNGSLKRHRISKDVMTQGIIGLKYAPIPSASINLDYRHTGDWRTKNVNQSLTVSLQSQY